jgi:hypothetical protein
MQRRRSQLERRKKKRRGENWFENAWEAKAATATMYVTLVCAWLQLDWLEIYQQPVTINLREIVTAIRSVPMHSRQCIRKKRWTLLTISMRAISFRRKKERENEEQEKKLIWYIFLNDDYKRRSGTGRIRRKKMLHGNIFYVRNIVPADSTDFNFQLSHSISLKKSVCMRLLDGKLLRLMFARSFSRDRWWKDKLTLNNVLLIFLLLLYISISFHSVSTAAQTLKLAESRRRRCCCGRMDEQHSFPAALGCLNNENIE